MSVITLKELTTDDATQVEIVQGDSKKNKGQKWTAIKLTIGDWSTLVFPQTRFEMDYIKQLMDIKE